MQIKQSPTTYDVCIVGSGAGGGAAAYVLTKAGVNVVMLEAGQPWDSSKDSKMMAWPYDSPRRGASTKERAFGEFDGCIGSWTIEGEPYTTAPNQRFDWYRARMLGGRTNHWGRISLRFGPDDFTHKSIDGLGDDWPIAYDELKPYYDQLDRFVGIFGSVEGLHNDPDGVFLPPPKPRCYELAIKKAADELKITCIPSRLSILTQSVNGRAQCHYCGQCGRGCATHSNFSSTSVFLPPALATGKLKIITGAMAREVLTNDNGLATGVSYVNTADGREYTVRSKAVVLAASACESARLMLNSKSSRHPNGLSNSSGQLGKNLTDSTGLSVSGFIPKMLDMPAHNEDGVGGMHMFMPWWIDNKTLDFPRGYHIEIYGGKHMPGYGFGGGIQYMPGSMGGGYGVSLKAEYRRYYGATVGFAGRGEMLPNANCYCEVDPNTVDKFGIPVLRFHWKWGQSEILQAKHMQETFRTIIQHMGGEALGSMPGLDLEYGLEAGGRIIHEAGATRMGADPKTSVLDEWCQAHEATNVAVCDAGPFVSNADKNCTWTIMALAWRTASHLADEMKKGNV
jgi:choline dehydrogenase-like flavoprotein